MKTYTTQQFAELIGVEYSTLRKWIERDLLKQKSERRFPNIEKFGNSWVFTERDLIKYQQTDITTANDKSSNQQKESKK